MRRWFFVALFIVLLGLLVTSVTFNYMLGSRRLDQFAEAVGASKALRYRETVFRPASNEKERIAMISLAGVISESERGPLSDNMVFDLIHAFRQATEDPTIKAVVLRIDSPGGEVTASDTIYSQLKRLRTKKPVVISMGASAASGAYYAACGGSYLIANESTTTGSIGVIVSIMNYKDLMGKAGLRSMVFKSGQYKDILSGARDMTQQEQDYMDLMVTQAYERFAMVVAEERKLSKISLKEKVGDGRIISGRDALVLKLVDANGTLEDAIDKAAELAGLTAPGVVHYTAPQGFFPRVPFFSANSGDGSVDLKLEVIPGPKIEAGKVYLLPAFLAH